MSPQSPSRTVPLLEVRHVSKSGQAALAALCRRRLWRNRAGLLRFAVAAAIPYFVLLIGNDHRWGPAAIAVTALLAAVLAVSGLGDTARRFHQQPHLAAHFGLDGRAARRTVMRILGAAAVLWAVLAGPALIFGGAGVMAVIVPAIAHSLFVYRATRAEYIPTYIMGG